MQGEHTETRTAQIVSGEIQDEIVTRSGGEIRRTQIPKVTSSTITSQEDQKPAFSPRASQKACSPHMNELRCIGVNVKGIEITQTPSPGTSCPGSPSS